MAVTACYAAGGAFGTQRRFNNVDAENENLTAGDTAGEEVDKATAFDAVGREEGSSIGRSIPRANSSCLSWRRKDSKLL